MSQQPTAILLVRHALPDQGVDMDPTLSGTGRAQAELLGEWLVHERPSMVYASHLQRARQTAAPLARRLGIDVRQHEGLREWTSARTHYVRPEDLAHTPEGRAFAEGRWEGFIPDHDRVALRTTMAATLREIARSHPGDTVVAVSHGGAINSLLAHAIGAEVPFFFNPAYAGISRLQVWPDGRFVLASVNESAHLDPDRMRAFVGEAQEVIA